jgi:hypothetical protein
MFEVETHKVSQLACSDNVFAPRWSPDRRYIAAISLGNTRLVLYGVKSAKWMPLNKELGAIGYLTRSHDSSSINFDSALNKEPGYYRLRVSDLKLEKLVDFKKMRFFPGQFGGAPWDRAGSRRCAAISERHQHAGDLRVRPAPTMIAIACASSSECR